MTSDLADPDSADANASAETTVGPVADLALTKSDAPDPVLAGELLTYTLGVSNSGPRDATGTTLTDTLPAGVTFDSATPSQGSCSEASGTVTCALGTIADQQSASVEIKVRPQAAGTITNQASVASDQGDSNTADNSASSETTVDPAADLSLTKSDSPDPVLAGELLTYTLAVQNAGPSSAAGVTLSDTLPAGVTYESATPIAGHLLRVERDRHLRARHDRRRPGRERGDQDPVRHARPPVQQRERRLADRRSRLRRQFRQRRHDRHAGRRPVADQERLARPGVRGRRAHLHARRYRTPDRRTQPASR